MKNLKNILTFSLLSAILLATAGCGKKADVAVVETPAKDVSAQSAKDSRQIKYDLEFPGMVVANQQANIVAKSGGNIKAFNFKIGDKIKLGDIIVKVDDAEKNSSASFNSSQVKQAQLGAAQAEASYQLAQNNYQSLLQSSGKDLNQAGIAQDQAKTGKDNLGQTTNESLKTAELAYESAKLAADQAKSVLDSRTKISVQSDADTRTNSDLAADTVANTCATIINSVNNIAGLDEKNFVYISYKNNLGVLDSTTLSKSKLAYRYALQANTVYTSTDFPNLDSKINAVISLAQKTKLMADAVKDLFDKTIASTDLPQSSLTGPSLSNLQAQAAGFQSQMNSALLLINGAKQGINSLDLNNTASLDSLAKAYELAKKQVAIAEQNLNSAKLGNKSQLDNAGFGVQSASNQFDSAKIRLDSQLSVSRSQVELARLTYQNALVALQSLYDSHLLIAPINGTLTQKLVAIGDAVTPGQLLASVSKTDDYKIQFYIDQANLPFVNPGLKVKISDNENHTIDGVISNVTPQADAVTKRFLVEVVPSSQDKKFEIGTVVSVSVGITKPAGIKNAFALPMSAIEIGQNDNMIFIIEDNKAKKIKVKIEKVEGETAVVTGDIKDSDMIITDGNKSLSENDLVKIK